MKTLANMFWGHVFIATYFKLTIFLLQACSIFFVEDFSYNDMIAKKIPKTYFACEKKNYKILLTLVLQNLLLFCAQNKNQRQLF